MAKICIGLILDSLIVSKQIKDLLILSKSFKYYEISHLILHENEEKSYGNIINKCLKKYS